MHRHVVYADDGLCRVAGRSPFPASPDEKEVTVDLVKSVLAMEARATAPFNFSSSQLPVNVGSFCFPKERWGPPLGDGENLVGFQAEEAAPHTSSILFGDFPILKACRIEMLKKHWGWGKATTKTTPVRSVRSSIPKPCPSFFLLFPFFEDAPRSSPAKNLKSSTLPSATTMHGCASGEAPEQSMFRGVVPPQ